MNEIKVDKDLVAYCGLYCGACPRYLKGKCAGCRDNEKLAWCKIRSCNSEHDFHSCADCSLMAYEDCKLNHNAMSKFFAFVFGSDRDACIERIKETSPAQFASEMAEIRCHTIKRRK